MASDSQIRALLKAWLDYIHVENLSNAKVEPDDSTQPNIWDSLVNLVGDKLLIDESLFKNIKQPFKNAKNFEQTKLPSIAVAFPQLYVVESNRRQFRPLFTINVSPIFEGNYRSSGWNLTEYEFQPVIPILMQWYGLEEEAAESLVTREGLKVFLETTFNRPFKTLQDFMGLIEIPPFPVRSKLLPYLLDFDYAAFNYNLKKDFQKISDQNYFQWSRPGHPAYEYLFGQPKAPQDEVLFLGADFCDRLCNYGMIIKTEPKASRLGANLIGCNVEGKLENNINWAEVDAVEALIEELLRAGYCLNSPDSDNTIGVISPYRRQVDALTQRLKSRWSDFSPKSIGTVHTFQGGQKSVIIFSTRQCSATDSLWFINRRPNLLNVAVSRARELFILVGDLGRISEGGYTRDLVEYIKEFGETR